MQNSADHQTAFVIRRVKKTFGPTEALNLSSQGSREVRIPRGRTTAVLGRSGSGKSTLLSILGLLERPDADVHTEITYFRCDGSTDAAPIHYASLSERLRLQLSCGEFATVLQDGHLIEHITVRENVGLGMSLPGGTGGEMTRVASPLVAGLGLEEKELSRPKELSGGEYQRVAVARAIAHGPRVVFADEPTGNLDIDTGAQVLAQLECWRDQRPEENTLVLVSHDVQQAWLHADYFIVLQDHDLKYTLTKDQLARPGPADWRTECGIPDDLTGIDALRGVLETSRAGAPEAATVPVWDRETSLRGRLKNMLWYAFRDLFPLKIRPFNWSIFWTTLRDTVFPVLTLVSFAVLVGVILLGIGVYAGVHRYVQAQQKYDVRANRLVATVDTSSSAHTINEESLTTLRRELEEVVCRPSLKDRILHRAFLGWLTSDAPPLPAVEGTVHGAAQAQLFIYTDSENSGVTALGTSVHPDSLLQERLTHGGMPLPERLIPDWETDGIIAKESWLRRILDPGPDEPFPPETIQIDYGGSGRGSTCEKLPVLGVIDDLPDGSFLIAPGCWHKIRDGNWRSCYRLAYLDISGTASLKPLAASLGARMKERGMPVIVKPYTDAKRGACIQLDCGNEVGWRQQYWSDVIWKNVVAPVLAEAGHSISADQCFTLDGPTAGATAVESELDYWAAIIYLRELGAALQVAEVVENGSTGWTIDPYVVNLCVLMDRTRQLSVLFSVVVGGCTFVLCAFNIFLLFFQRVLRKRHALGVLKAFGSPRTQIIVLFVLESLYLSLAGAVIGVLAAWCGGVTWLGEKLKEIFQIQWGQPLFYLAPEPVTLVVGACVTLCVLITVAATFRTVGKTANELLRQRE